MDKITIFNLIAKDKSNLIKIAKAVRVDFEAMLGYYVIFDKMPVKKALLKVSEDIEKEYQGKEDIWIKLQEELNHNFLNSNPRNYEPFCRG